MPAASARAARPPTSPAPPAAAASFRTSARVSLRWNESPCLVILSPLFDGLVAGRADHEQHLGRIVAGVAHAMRCRAPVVHAVAGAEVVDVGAELHVHAPPDDDEHLLGVSVGVRLVAGGAAWVELRGDD